MKTTVYIPGDSSALAMGASRVAAAIQKEAQKRKLEIEVIRNGSRGMYFLEPLVEVLTPKGRLAYGPVGTSDVPALFDAGFLKGTAHPLYMGPTEEIPYFKKQERYSLIKIVIQKSERMFLLSC